ncbi:hypothetical protein D9M69_503570 [compost metagenome]
MVVHVIGTEFGVHFLGEIAERQAVLAVIIGVTVGSAADDHALVRVAPDDTVIAQHALYDGRDGP